MRKGLRSSARKEQVVQNKIEEKSRLRERSSELHEDIERSSETLNKQIEELCSKVNVDESSSEESVVASDDESDTEDSRKLESPQKFVSESSLVWDGQGDLQSPLKDTSDILDTSFTFTANQDSLPPALSRGRSVSVSVNRADYSSLDTGEIVELHPVCRDLNKRFEALVPSSSLRLISQDSFLDRNLQAKEAEVFDLIQEGILETDETNVEEITIIEENSRSNMDEERFKNHVKKFKNDSRKVVRKINEYTAKDVLIAHANSYEKKLEKARNAYDQVRDAIDQVMDDLDPVTETEKIGELEKILSDLLEAVKKNEKEVMEKITEIVNQADANKPRNEEDLKKDEYNVLRLQKKIGCLKEKANKLKSSILKIKKVSEMTDNEIREKFIESKTWEKKVAEMEESRDAIDAESVGSKIEDKELLDMKEIVQACVDLMENKKEHLELEDNKRGLFTTINKNLSRENVVFPENFSGEFGENVFKFKEKFMQALNDSQVREQDKVETLRKHLSGHAKTLIGAHYTDINKALSSLIDYFGNSDRIWSKCKERFEKFFAGNSQKIWGRKGDECRIMAVSKVIKFLREAIELAESYKVLEGEIYHSSTLTLITNVLPHSYFDRYAELIEGQEKNASKKLLIESLKGLLENMRSQEITKDSLLLRKDDVTLRKVTTIEDDQDFKDNYEGGGRQHENYGDRRDRHDYYRGGRDRRGNYGGGRGRKDNYGGTRG